MLRRLHIPEPYVWIVLWLMVALLLLAAEAMLFPQVVMTIAHQLQEGLTSFILQDFVGG